MYRIALSMTLKGDPLRLNYKFLNQRFYSQSLKVDISLSI